MGKPPQSLLTRGPDRLPCCVKTKSLDLLSLHIFAALYMAGTHISSSDKSKPPPFKSKQKPTGYPSSSDPNPLNDYDLPYKAVPIQSNAQSAAEIHKLKEGVASNKYNRMRLLAQLAKPKDLLCICSRLLPSSLSLPCPVPP